MTPELNDKLAKIDLLILDVDGILSDGSIYYGNQGEEIKGFSILDGLGIKLLQKADIDVAIITGRQSQIVARRARELGIQHLLQGREDKLIAMRELLEHLKLTENQCAYMGDDLPDLGAIVKAGVGLTVPNAHSFVIEHADYCTKAYGGKGAVREISDQILEAKGLKTQFLNEYLPD